MSIVTRFVTAQANFEIGDWVFVRQGNGDWYGHIVQNDPQSKMARVQPGSAKIEMHWRPYKQLEKIDPKFRFEEDQTAIFVYSGERVTILERFLSSFGGEKTYKAEVKFSNGGSQIVNVIERNLVDPHDTQDSETVIARVAQLLFYIGDWVSVDNGDWYGKIIDIDTRNSTANVAFGRSRYVRHWCKFEKLIKLNPIFKYSKGQQAFNVKLGINVTILSGFLHEGTGKIQYDVQYLDPENRIIKRVVDQDELYDPYSSEESEPVIAKRNAQRLQVNIFPNDLVTMNNFGQVSFRVNKVLIYPTSIVVSVGLGLLKSDSDFFNQSDFLLVEASKNKRTQPKFWFDQEFVSQSEIDHNYNYKISQIAAYYEDYDVLGWQYTFESVQNQGNIQCCILEFDILKRFNLRQHHGDDPVIA